MQFKIFEGAEKMKLCILGLGYVGLPIYFQAKFKGFDVFGFDIDEKKVKELKKGITEIKGRIPEQGFQRFREHDFTSDKNWLKEADTFVICVPTPIDEFKNPDYSCVVDATQLVIDNGKKGSLVCEESTVNPGTMEEVVKPLFEQADWKVDKDYYLVHCPERIDPGNKKYEVDNIPRCIGGLTEKSLEKGYELYSRLIDAPIKKMSSIRAAEMTKIVENTFRDVNIAYVNQLAKISDVIDVDIKEVIEGAATKPYAFMPHWPGIGIGGHCIPVDPYYLIEYSKHKGLDPKFLSLAREVNDSMPKYSVGQVQAILNELGKPMKNTKVLILGYSYKANVSDERETPSKEVLKILKERLADVKVYDPFIVAKSDFKSLNDALQWAEVVVLCTAHNEFIENVPKLIGSNVKIFFDGRNVFDKDLFESKGIRYKGIGR